MTNCVLLCSTPAERIKKSSIWATMEDFFAGFLAQPIPQIVPTAPWMTPKSKPNARPKAKIQQRILDPKGSRSHTPRIPVKIEDDESDDENATKILSAQTGNKGKWEQVETYINPDPSRGGAGRHPHSEQDTDEQQEYYWNRTPMWSHSGTKPLAPPQRPPSMHQCPSGGEKRGAVKPQKEMMPLNMGGGKTQPYGDGAYQHRPKPAPPRLYDVRGEENVPPRRYEQEGWEPPKPPKSLKAPLCPKPYGRVGESGDKGAMETLVTDGITGRTLGGDPDAPLQQDCSLQLCPIWVLKQSVPKGLQQQYRQRGLDQNQDQVKMVPKASQSGGKKNGNEGEATMPGTKPKSKMEKAADSGTEMESDTSESETESDEESDEVSMKGKMKRRKNKKGKKEGVKKQGKVRKLWLEIKGKRVEATYTLPTKKKDK